MVLWELGLIFIVVFGFGGLGLLAAGITFTSGNFRKSMKLLFVAAFFAVMSSLTTAMLFLLSLDITHVLWNVVLYSFLVAESFYIVSMKTLTDMYGKGDKAFFKEVSKE